MIYKIYDVVVIPFPFTDQRTEKRRPALVLSDFPVFNRETKNCVMAMITSTKNSDWPLDIDIIDIHKAGLPAPSKVRMKLFTLDTRFIIKKVGTLSQKDQMGVKANLRKLLCIDK